MKNDEMIIIEFPLKGEWSAPNTPGDKVPSHGTDSLGQRYAYDFFQTDANSKNKYKFYRSSSVRYRMFGVSINDCYCYQEPVYSPVTGEVVVVKDGVGEPGYLHPAFDFLKVVLRTISAIIQGILIPSNKIKLHKYIGNHVIIKYKKYYLFFAHMSPGTITVKEGQSVKVGDIIGKIGHSGNSTAPHLHFHVMDSPDLLTAKGVPCAFRKYLTFKDCEWQETKNGIPVSSLRIRV